MNIADAVNPFFFRHNTVPGRDPAPPQLITEPGQTTIYSAVDEVTIASDFAGAEYATIVKDEEDLVIYGLDVVLAQDLLHQDRSAKASRNISIFCRSLTILGSEDKGRTIDVSGHVDERYSRHIQPDVAAALESASEKAANGNDIAYALKNPSHKNPWSNYFIENPGAGWGETGASGGTITIACETLVLHSKLHLKANGGRGNAGVGGQNIKNWVPGLAGGDAGKGGRGGDGGKIELSCSRVVGKDAKPVDLLEWVTAESNGGKEGDPGLPGSAYDTIQKNHHYGSLAAPADPAESTAPALILPNELSFIDQNDEQQKMKDLSVVAASFDLHYWGLLFHRVKYEYLKHQPMTFHLPQANDSKWIKLGKLIDWADRFSFVYGRNDGDPIVNESLEDITDDSQKAAKDSIAGALRLMAVWYRTGKTMWGMSISTVPPLPFDVLCKSVDGNFSKQKEIQKFYITLRNEVADARVSNDFLVNARNAAKYAVAMHKANVDALKDYLFGDSDNSGVDSRSLVGELNAADSSCNTLIKKLSKDLKYLDDYIKSRINIGVDDVLESVKSLCFVITDPPALVGMLAAEGTGMFLKARDTITDDSGATIAKDAAIKKIHNFKGSLDDLSELVGGMVANGSVGKLDEAILTTLDNIDEYISNFTNMLTDVNDVNSVGEVVLADISELRRRVNYKNALWLDYNDRLLQLTKEWQEFQEAQAKEEKIGEPGQKITASLIDAVQFYTSLYLTNLERCADLWAQLVRKYAYVTLGDPLPSEGLLRKVTKFWDEAEGAAAQGIADQADKNWDLTRSTVVGKNSSSLRTHLKLYNEKSQSIVLKSPDENENIKSTFYVSIQAGRTEEEGQLITDLLNHRAVWLQVTPSEQYTGKYSHADGSTVDYPFWVRPDDPGRTKSRAYATPLLSAGDWDVRITHVNPWIEGVMTDSVGLEQPRVNFHIKLGTMGYIMGHGRSLAHFFDYNKHAMSTQFTHWADIKVADKTNDGKAGGPAGEVSSDDIEMRGIFLPLQLSLPRDGFNAGLRAAGDIGSVNLNIHFRVIFRA